MKKRSITAAALALFGVVVKLGWSSHLAPNPPSTAGPFPPGCRWREVVSKASTHTACLRAYL